MVARHDTQLLTRPITSNALGTLDLIILSDRPTCAKLSTTIEPSDGERSKLSLSACHIHGCNPFFRHLRKGIKCVQYFTRFAFSLWVFISGRFRIVSTNVKLTP